MFICSSVVLLGIGLGLYIPECCLIIMVKGLYVQDCCFIMHRLGFICYSLLCHSAWFRVHMLQSVVLLGTV